MRHRRGTLVLPVLLLAAGHPLSAALCSQYRDDDDGIESNASIDFGDNWMEKTISLPTGPGDADYALVWIYGRPYNYKGFTFQEREDYYILVNGNDQQKLWFDVGSAFDERDDIYQWKSFRIPPSWLVTGDNTLFVHENPSDNALEHWNTNNLRVGVDETTDLDRSWWYGNGVFTCDNNPANCTGELMIYIELCEVPATPTVSAWGLVATALIVLTAGTLLVARRRAA